MGFTVDAASLDGLPKQIDRLQHDALLGESYVNDHAKLSYGGVLDRITGNHESVVHAVRDYLDRLARKVAGNSSEAVQAALVYYAHTDAKAAAALDGTYPATSGPHADGPGNYGATSYSSSAYGGRFRDVAHPSDRYVPPPDHSAEFPDEPKPIDLISPASYARRIIVQATELAESLGLGHRWDPYETILKPCTGDWKGLRGCTDVFERVGEALGDMATNLRAGAYDVPEVWTGNAADGLTGYLLKVANELDGAKAPLDDLGKAYEKAAKGAHELFDALGELLSALIDDVLIFIAELAVAEGTSWTGVGAAIGGAGAALEAYEIYREIKRAVELFAAIRVVVDDFNATLRHGAGMVNVDLDLPVLDEAKLQLPGDQSRVGGPKVGPANK
jgi:hypothetical protein